MIPGGNWKDLHVKENGDLFVFFLSAINRWKDGWMRSEEKCTVNCIVLCQLISVIRFEKTEERQKNFYRSWFWWIPHNIWDLRVNQNAQEILCNQNQKLEREFGFTELPTVDDYTVSFTRRNRSSRDEKKTRSSWIRHKSLEENHSKIQKSEQFCRVKMSIQNSREDICWKWSEEPLFICRNESSLSIGAWCGDVL